MLAASSFAGHLRASLERKTAIAANGPATGYLAQHDAARSFPLFTFPQISSTETAECGTTMVLASASGCTPAKRREHGLVLCVLTRPNAQADGYFDDPNHRGRADHHRPGLRIRLFRHPGLPSLARRGIPDRPPQFQSGDDKDQFGT